MDGRGPAGGPPFVAKSAALKSWLGALAVQVPAPRPLHQLIWIVGIRNTRHMCQRSHCANRSTGQLLSSNHNPTSYQITAVVHAEQVCRRFDLACCSGRATTTAGGNQPSPWPQLSPEPNSNPVMSRTCRVRRRVPRGRRSACRAHGAPSDGAAGGRASGRSGPRTRRPAG